MLKIRRESRNSSISRNSAKWNPNKQTNPKFGPGDQRDKQKALGRTFESLKDGNLNNIMTLKSWVQDSTKEMFFFSV